jgi:hypothetical protein
MVLSHAKEGKCEATVNCDRDVRISNSRTVSDVRVRTRQYLAIFRTKSKISENIWLFDSLAHLILNVTCIKGLEGLWTGDSEVIDIKICESNFRECRHYS